MDVGCLVSGPQKRAMKGYKILSPKSLLEEEHLQQHLNRNYAQYRRCPFDDLEDPSKLLDTPRNLLDKIAWEQLVQNPFLPFLNDTCTLMRFMPIPSKESERV